MDKIKNYIKSNYSQFDKELPNGHRDRFLSKYEKSRDNKRIFLKISVSAAIITLLIWPFVNISNRDCSLDLNKYKRVFEKHYTSVYKKADKLNDQDKTFIIETLDLINNQAIPIEDQLPDFIDACDVTQYTKEYYTNKIESLEIISNTIDNLINN